LPAKDYRDLVAWQKAMDLVDAVYRMTREFPRDEVHGLTSQIRRAAVSVPSNIAEGQGRRSAKEFLQHLSVAYGSLREVETQALIAQRLGYLTDECATQVGELAGEVGRLVNGLARSVPRAHR